MKLHVLSFIIWSVILKFCTAQILDTPENVTISDVQKTRFTVSWDSPNSPGSYEAHLIMVTSLNDEELFVNETLSENVAETISVDVTELLPGVTYNVTVTAVHNNNSLSSAPSDPEIQTTVPNAVTLSEYDATTTSVTAQWTWLEADDGVAEHFNVYCGSGYPTKTTIYVTGDTLYNATCNNVTSGGNVTIVVSSTSGDKTSDNDTIIISAVPSAVTLSEYDATTTSVTAQWTWLEADDGVAEHFNVYCGSGDPTKTTIYVTGDTLYNATCNNVTSGGNVTIVVSSTSGDKTSDNDTIIISAVPSAVQLSEYDATTTSVTAQWTWLEADDGVAEHFNVYCGSGDPTKTTIYVTGDTLYNATCNNVTSGGNVTIVVSSTSGDKTSDNDTIIISAVPSAVQLSEYDATTTSVTAQWTWLEADDGVAEHFNVYCGSGDPTKTTIYVTGDTLYNATCNNVTSGGNVTIVVSSTSGDKTSDNDTIIISAVPSAVQLSEYDATTTSVTAQWTWLEADDGVAEHFNVYCGSGDPTKTTIPVTGDTLYNATCNNVTPGGNVTIVVSSTSGDKTSDNDTIIISAVPETVLNFRETSVTNETITVSWKAPTGDVDFYQISCFENATPQTVEHTNETTYTAECNKLTPGEEYKIIVTAYSNQKAGEASSITVITTPNNVKLEEGPSTTMSVTAYWRKPSGVFDSFNVSCGEATAYPSYIPYNNNLGDTINASCINVMSGSTHNLKVVTISGAETSSDTISLTALPSAVQLSEYDANTTSVTAQWTWSEADDGVAEHFNVYCGSGDPTKTTIYVTGDTLYNATCSDVTPGGNVIIVVSSTSGDKTSENDTIAISAVPEIVQYLIEKEATLDTITATWQSPIGDVEFYQITCSGGDAKPERLNHISGQDMYNASCVELTSGEDYTLTVLANSNGKQGEEDNVNIFAVPNAVQLSEYDANTTSVTAQWPWSEAADGVAEHFDVYCGSGDPTKTTISVTGDTLYNATCSDVTPGGNVIIVVSSTSGDKTSENDTIAISAVPEIVQYLIEKEATLDTITATWQSPIGDVEFYQITCSGGDAKPERLNHISGQDMYNASCVELTSGEDYTLTVLANSNGKQGEEDNVNIFAVPNAVQLSEYDANTTSVTAQWPWSEAADGVAEHFDVYCGSGDPTKTTISVTGDTLYNATCSDVTPGGNVTIVVSSTSGDKTSETDTIAISAVPEAVNLIVKNTSNETIKVEWEAAEGYVDFYNVYCPEKPSSMIESVEDSDNIYSETCTGLTPGTTYIIAVSANSNEKEGENKSVTVVTIPNSVQLIEESPTTINVTASWLKPFGGVNSFNITCDDGDTQASPSYIQSSDISDTDKIEASCINVIPGSTHVLEVTTVSSEETSSNSISLTALPEKVQNLTKADATTESITASWEAPIGEVDNYAITCSGGNVTEPMVPDDGPLRASCTGLTPGTMYTITVVANSKEKSGQREEVNIYSIPEKPTNLELTFGERSVEVNWDQPIGGFTSYHVVLINDMDVVQKKITASMSVSFEELNPDSDYTVTITTINNEDTSEAVSESGKTQEAPAPIPTEMPPEETQITTNSFTVPFSSSYFSEENGKIRNYTVIVSEESAKYEPLEDSNGNFNNWDDARSGDTITPYQAFEFEPYFENNETQNRRKKRQTTNKEVSITIGKMDCGGRTNEYCNHWLKDDRTYVYKFYACTDGGCTESPYSGPIEIKKDYTTLIIALSVVGGVLLIIIIVIVAIIVLRRSGSIKKRDHSGNNNENLLLGNRQSIKSKSHSRPIRLMQFAEHYRAMKSDSEYHFSEEYEEIREVGINQSKDAAIAPVNRTKNRFTNILPYDHTRVKLAPADDEEGSDYINANYMPGYNSPREFIACQGPLPATEDDMWKLIWEQHVATIVMVTQLTERGRVKCHHYWPFDNNPTYYGDIMVTIEKENNLPHWTIREFKLEYNGRIRHVRHFSYLAWPDHGVPDSTDTILKFVNNVRRQVPKDGTPTLVHCSAGVGRTGTFICLDRLVQHMREHDYVDIFGIVCEMRMSRNLMVQTEKQYIFIHQCVLAILQGHSNTQNEAIYENGGFSAS